MMGTVAEEVEVLIAKLEMVRFVQAAAHFMNSE